MVPNCGPYAHQAHPFPTVSGPAVSGPHPARPYPARPRTASGRRHPTVTPPKSADAPRHRRHPTNANPPALTACLIPRRLASARFFRRPSLAPLIWRPYSPPVFAARIRRPSLASLDSASPKIRHPQSAPFYRRQSRADARFPVSFAHDYANVACKCRKHATWLRPLSAAAHASSVESPAYAEQPSHARQSQRQVFSTFVPSNAAPRGWWRGHKRPRDRDGPVECALLFRRFRRLVPFRHSRTARPSRRTCARDARNVRTNVPDNQAQKSRLGCAVHAACGRGLGR